MRQKAQKNFQLTTELIADIESTCSRLSEVMGEPVERSFVAAVALEQFLSLPDSRKAAMLADWKTKRMRLAVKVLEDREKKRP